MRISLSTFTSLALAAPLALALAACDSKGAESASNHPLVNNPAPAFTVDQVPEDKGQVDLGKYQGKVVLLDIWGTFCEPCKQSFPKLDELNTKYGAQGLAIIGVSVDDADVSDKDEKEKTEKKIDAFVKETGARFTIGWDPSHKVADQYKPPTMPSSFLIDKKGVVRYVHSGWHEGEADELDKEIKGLLAE